MISLGEKVKIRNPWSLYDGCMGRVDKIDGYVWVELNGNVVAFYREHIERIIKVGDYVKWNGEDGVILEVDKRKESGKIRFNGQEIWVMISELDIVPKYKIRKRAYGKRKVD